jgi:hypothetical protein
MPTNTTADQSRLSVLIDWHVTSRNFALGEFRDARDQACSIQESSLATESAIWLGLQRDQEPSRMHLLTEHAYVVAFSLEAFTSGDAVRSTALVAPQRFIDRYGVRCFMQMQIRLNETVFCLGAESALMELSQEIAAEIAVALRHFIEDEDFRAYCPWETRQP